MRGVVRLVAVAYVFVVAYNVLSVAREVYKGKYITFNMFEFESTRSVGGYGGFAGGKTIVESHRPASLILQNPKLPDWVKEYAAWHEQERARYLDAKRTNSTSADDVRFLIMRCLQGDTCGEESDRLQDAPLNIKLANQTNRVLLIRWEKPAPLETFLVPPKDGIDWRIPDDMYEMLKADVLKDMLRWNRQMLGGKKNMLLVRIIDGQMNGRLARCPTCLQGRVSWSRIFVASTSLEIGPSSRRNLPTVYLGFSFLPPLVLSSLHFFFVVLMAAQAR